MFSARPSLLGLEGLGFRVLVGGEGPVDVNNLNSINGNTTPATDAYTNVCRPP